MQFMTQRGGSADAAVTVTGDTVRDFMQHERLRLKVVKCQVQTHSLAGSPAHSSADSAARFSVLIPTLVDLPQHAAW